MSVQKLAQNIAETVDKKGAAYGNAIDFVEKTLTELYPNGIPVTAYKDALITVRVLDKLKRLSTDPNAFGESPWEDIVGYALRGAEKARAGKGTLFGIAPSTYKPLKKLEQINPSLFSRNVPFYVPADQEYDPTIYREVKSAQQQYEDHLKHVKEHESILAQYPVAYRFVFGKTEPEITDEDVYTAVDVLVELVCEPILDWSLSIAIYDTLIDLGWSEEDLRNTILSAVCK